MSEESRVAVLETRMNYLEKVVAESQKKMGDAIEAMERIIANHEGSIRRFEEDREDKKKLINMIYAALIGALIEPILIGLAFWVATKGRP